MNSSSFCFLKVFQFFYIFREHRKIPVTAQKIKFFINDFFSKGAYIKYVGGGLDCFTNFSNKNFVVQQTIELNISWLSTFFRKYFMASPINFRFLFNAYLQQYFRAVLTVIFKFQITKEVNIHNNIQINSPKNL